MYKLRIQEIKESINNVTNKGYIDLKSIINKICHFMFPGIRPDKTFLIHGKTHFDERYSVSKLTLNQASLKALHLAVTVMGLLRP